MERLRDLLSLSQITSHSLSSIVQPSSIHLPISPCLLSFPPPKNFVPVQWYLYRVENWPADPCPLKSGFSSPGSSTHTYTQRELWDKGKGKIGFRGYIKAHTHTGSISLKFQAGQEVRSCQLLFSLTASPGDQRLLCLMKVACIILGQALYFQKVNCSIPSWCPVWPHLGARHVQT